MAPHGSFSSHPYRSGRRACHSGGVPDCGHPQPGADGCVYVNVRVNVNVYACIYAYAYVSAYVSVYVNVNGNAHTYSYVYAYANGNAYARVDTHTPSLAHPDSGCAAVCSCRRIGCVAN